MCIRDRPFIAPESSIHQKAISSRVHNHCPLSDMYFLSLPLHTHRHNVSNDMRYTYFSQELFRAHFACMLEHHPSGYPCRQNGWCTRSCGILLYLLMIQKTWEET